MKRFIFIVSLILLVACGNKVHENIDEKMAEDTQQIIDIFDKAIKEKRSLTDDEVFIVEDYQLLYRAKKNNPAVAGLTEEEERLFNLTNDIIDMRDELILKKSNHESYGSFKTLIKSVIKTGTIYD